MPIVDYPTYSWFQVEERPAKKDKKMKEAVPPKPAAKRRKKKDDEDGVEEGGKKKRKKKDPNAPKRALSAFMRFQLAERKVNFGHSLIFHSIRYGISYFLPVYMSDVFLCLV